MSFLQLQKLEIQVERSTKQFDTGWGLFPASQTAPFMAGDQGNSPRSAFKYLNLSSWKKMLLSENYTAGRVYYCSYFYQQMLMDVNLKMWNRKWTRDFNNNLTLLHSLNRDTYRSHTWPQENEVKKKMLWDLPDCKFLRLEAFPS